MKVPANAKVKMTPKFRKKFSCGRRMPSDELRIPSCPAFPPHRKALNRGVVGSHSGALSNAFALGWKTYLF